MFKKKIPWMLVFLLIAGFSIYTVLNETKTFSVDLLQEQLSTAHPLTLIMAAVSMTGFIIFEGLAVGVLIKGLTGKDRYKECITYGAADVYFSAITPSATGGQPASGFFMVWDDIPFTQTTVILLINLILYTYALLACGVLAAVLEWDTFFELSKISKVLVLLGSLFMAGLSALYWLVLKKEKLVEKTLYICVSAGEKLHLVKNGDALREKIGTSMEQYKTCSSVIKSKRKVIMAAFVLNLLQRLSQSLVTVFSYLALDGTVKNALRMWAIQILCTLGSNTIPVPGAMGVADYLMLDGFSQVEDIMSPANLEVVSRGLSFYLCVAISIIIVITGYLRRKIKNRKGV